MALAGAEGRRQYSKGTPVAPNDGIKAEGKAAKEAGTAGTLQRRKEVNAAEL